MATDALKVLFTALRTASLYMLPPEQRSSMSQRTSKGMSFIPLTMLRVNMKPKDRSEQPQQYWTMRTANPH